MNGDGGVEEVTKKVERGEEKSRSRKKKNMAEKVVREKEKMVGKNDMQKAAVTARSHPQGVKHRGSDTDAQGTC